MGNTAIKLCLTFCGGGGDASYGVCVPYVRVRDGRVCDASCGDGVCGASCGDVRDGDDPYVRVCAPSCAPYASATSSCVHDLCLYASVSYGCDGDDAYGVYGAYGARDGRDVSSRASYGDRDVLYGIGGEHNLIKRSNILLNFFHKYFYIVIIF